MRSGRRLSEQTLRIKAGGADRIPWQVMADPNGSNRAYLTEPVVLAPGQRLAVNVESRIRPIDVRDLGS